MSEGAAEALSDLLGLAGCNVNRTRMRLPSGRSSGARNFSGKRKAANRISGAAGLC